jgi:hypothetical protein
MGGVERHQMPMSEMRVGNGAGQIAWGPHDEKPRSEPYERHDDEQ